MKTISIAVGSGYRLTTTLKITTLAVDTTPEVALATLTSTMLFALNPTENSEEFSNALSSGDLIIIGGALGSAALLILVVVSALMIRRRQNDKNAEYIQNHVVQNNPYAGSSRRAEGPTVPYPFWGNTIAPATNQYISMARPTIGQYSNSSTIITLTSIPQPMNGGQMYSTAGRQPLGRTFNAAPNTPLMFAAPQSMYNSKPRTATSTAANQWQGTHF